MNRKFSLKDIIDKIDWIALNQGDRASWSLPVDAIAISYIKSLKDKKIADHVKVRIGKDIMSQLEWQQGDKVVAMHDPDDVFSFLLAKSNGVNGRPKKLTAEKGTHVSIATFKWDKNTIPLKPSRSIIVEHDVYKGYLHFRLPNG